MWRTVTAGAREMGLRQARGFARDANRVSDGGIELQHARDVPNDEFTAGGSRCGTRERAEVAGGARG
jgi:hypothetical protein